MTIEHDANCSDPRGAMGKPPLCTCGAAAKAAEQQLAELTAILGPEPVERAKALISTERELDRERNISALISGWFADLTTLVACTECGAPVDERCNTESASAVHSKRIDALIALPDTVESLRAALAEKDALLQQQADTHKDALVAAKRSGFISAVGALHNAMPEGFVERDSDKIIARVAALVRELSESWRLTPPHDLVLHCPNCGKQHLDIGEFATRVHRKHLCENTMEGPGTGCGHLWVPFPYATKGVQFTVTQAAFAIGHERDALKAKAARLRERVAELEEQASMACQEPRDDCSCAGCRYADEVNREVKP